MQVTSNFDHRNLLLFYKGYLMFKHVFNINYIRKCLRSVSFIFIYVFIYFANTELIDMQDKLMKYKKGVIIVTHI